MCLLCTQMIVACAHWQPTTALTQRLRHEAKLFTTAFCRKQIWEHISCCQTDHESDAVSTVSLILRMPSGLRSERRLFARDRFFFFFLLSLHFTASRSSKQSLKLRHKTRSLTRRPNHIPSRSLFIFSSLLSLMILFLGQHLWTQRCYHMAISMLSFSFL